MSSRRKIVASVFILLDVGALTGTLLARQQQAPPRSSYQFPVAEESFRTVFARVTAAKADVMARQMALLNSRYDLSDRPAAGVTMSRGKPIQEGVRIKLPAGTTWDALAA